MMHFHCGRQGHTREFQPLLSTDIRACSFFFSLAVPVIQGRRYNSISPCPSPRPLSVQHVSCFVFSSCFPSSSLPFHAISVLNTFLGMCSLSLLFTCPNAQVQSYLRDLFGSLCHSHCPLGCVRSRSCICVSHSTSTVAFSSRSPQSVCPATSSIYLFS